MMDQVEANCKRVRADILAKKSTAQNGLSSNDRLLNVDIKKRVLLMMTDVRGSAKCWVQAFGKNEQS